MALTDPAWPQSRSPVAPAPAVTPSPAPNNYFNPALANTNPPNNRGYYRGFDRRADPRNSQADNRNDPASQYRNNDARYDYRRNSVDAARSAATFRPADISATPVTTTPAANTARRGSGQPADAIRHPGPNVHLSRPAKFGAGRCSV